MLASFTDHRPMTYEDWLALSDEERDDVHFNCWNVYDRDNIAIPFIAAGRLAQQSKWKVLEIRIGTYHCGEYVLRMTVSEEDYQHCPPMLAEQFEGFRVIWCPEPTYESKIIAPTKMLGKWRSEQGDYEFEVRWTDIGVEVTGKVCSTGEVLQISGANVCGEEVSFSTHEDGRDVGLAHVLTPTSQDRCMDALTRMECFRRVEAEA
jgi:hypothetical protein